MKLDQRFYRSPDAVSLARALLGKTLVTRLPLLPDQAAAPAVLTALRITETEAYAAPDDRASHAYGNRRTPRTETMFAAGGIAYVYLCYGMHHLFNVVTGPADLPHAILIRAGLPLEGIEQMRARVRTATGLNPDGPGRLTRLLGIRTAHNGLSLCGDRIWLEDRGFNPAPETIQALPRVGVAYAGEHAARPWRFLLKKASQKYLKFVSG